MALSGYGFELKSGYTKNWVRRYFTLQDSVLGISSKQGEEASQSVILTAGRAERVPGTPIVAVLTVDRALFVRFDENLDAWVGALQERIRRPSFTMEDGSCDSLTGYLQKRGQKEIMVASWKKRWFVLSNGFLKYYGNQKDVDSLPLGVVSVRSAILEQNADQLTFTLVCDPGTPFTRRLEMMAENAIAWDLWIQELSKMCRQRSAMAAPGGAGCVMSGFMTKRGRVVSSWKRRFFILDKTSLRYFRGQKEEELILALGSIPLEDAVVEPKEGGFAITSPGRNLVIKCDSPKETEKWIQSIRSCVGAAMIPTEEQPRKITGWLTKRGRKIQTWQRRWCVLENRCLSYFESPEAEQQAPAGVVHLKGCDVQPVKDFDKYGRDCCFEISSFGRLLVLQADHDGVLQDWIEIVREHSSGRGRMVLRPPTAISAAPAVLREEMSPTADEPPPPSTQDDQLPVARGDRPDAYQILHIVGRGGFGKVFLVRDKESGPNGPLIAMKTLQKVRLVAAKQVKYVVEERNLMAAVSTQRHPFILSLLRTFQTPHKLYMVLEFSPGGELRHRMFRFGGRFPEDIVRFIAAELFLAVDFLHRINIVHRDIKTENVLLDAEGHVKLCDFGLARKVEDTRLKSFVGTPEYLAPEIVTGAGHGKEVDWWAFGILVYECLVGETPFIGPTPENTYQRIVRETAQMPTSMPPKAKDLLIRLLAPKPQDRISPADIRDHAFFKGLNWEKVMERKIKSPLRQNTARKNAYMNNFDPSFIAVSAPRDSICPMPPAADPQMALMENYDWSPPF